MKSIIPIDDSLKEIKFLYIENDESLRDLDKDNLELVLGGMGAWADLSDFNIEYLFSAHLSPETFNKIKDASHILINTSFMGISGDLLYNFVLGAIKKGLKDKVIINCIPLSCCGGTFDKLKEKIKQLDEKQNICFYFPSSNMNAFVKFNNIEGFTLK
jgi:hypothetical protein